MKTIIVIEDDEAIRHAFGMLLEQHDYKVTAFESGAPVMQNLVEAPDLFLIDKNISGTNGIDLCRFIKANSSYQHVPVIVMSATPGILGMATEAGAVDVIIKPFTIKAVKQTIEKYM